MQIHLYKCARDVQRSAVMQMLKKILMPALLVALMAGCATSLITNLTPTQVPRNPTGQYLVEMKLDTTQQTLRVDSVTPYVMVGLNEYKMRPTLKMTNRFETYVTVPPGQDSIVYHFKVNYLYNRFGKPGEASMQSSDYKLTIK